MRMLFIVTLVFLAGCSGLPKMSIGMKEEKPKPTVATQLPKDFQFPVLVDAKLVGSLGQFDRILSPEQRELVAHAIHREPAGTYGGGNRAITVYAARPYESYVRCRRFILTQRSPDVRLDRVACHDGGNTWVVQEPKTVR